MNILLWLSAIEASTKTLHAVCAKIKATGSTDDLIHQRKAFVREAEGLRSEIEVFHKFALIELDKQITRSKEQITNLSA
jgi:hypothetical protein